MKQRVSNARTAHPGNSHQRLEGKRVTWALVGVALLACLVMAGQVFAARVQRTSLNIVVKNGETDQPIPNARLTLRFLDPRGKLKPAKWFSYSAKTNPQGRYKFVNIPKGPVHVIVTAERHQTYGKDHELTEDNQVIEIKLRKPQPLL